MSKANTNLEGEMSRMEDNTKYFHGTDDCDFSKLKETGLGGRIRTAAILADSRPDASATNMHEWATEASILRIALYNAQNDPRCASSRAVHNYDIGARAQLEKRLG